MIRVLHILHNMDIGGIENALMNYYRYIDHKVIQFDFLLTATGECLFEKEIIEQGGKIFRIPPLLKLNPLKYILALNSFFKDHREYKIVHSHSCSKSFIPLLIARHNKIPYRIAHSHTTANLKGLNGILRKLLKKPLQKTANYWLACSNEAARFLYGKHALHNEKTKIIKNIIDTQRFDFNLEKRKEIRKRLDIKDDEITVGTVARLNPVKNQVFILKIIKKLKERGYKVRGIFVGDGELREKLEHQSGELGIKAECIFTRGISNVEDYYQGMDVFLLPSIKEGLGMSVIEAQTSGLECLVSTGVPEECDVTGLVSHLPINEGVDLWCDKIIKIFPDKRKSRKEKIMESGYDAKTGALELQNFYIQLS